MPEMLPRHVILVTCPDEMGLIHRATAVLQANNLNIECNHEFVDTTEKQFFMRTEVSGEVTKSLQDELMKVLPGQASVRVTTLKKRPLVICATKEPHCLGELLLLNACGELQGDIKAVVSNHDSLRQLVERFDIPFHHVPHEGISREDHEAALLKVIEIYQPDYVILARYMRVVTKLHPSPDTPHHQHSPFLPARFRRGQPLPSGVCPGREADWRNGPLCDGRTGCRADYRARRNTG